MFIVHFWGGKKGSHIKSYHHVADAITAAATEAQYGDSQFVTVNDDSGNTECLAQFYPKEIQYASQRERQTRELQICARVLPGL